jgi:organic radical activating enzyme
MLVSRGYLKILMSPQLEVINGQKATIKTMDLQPLDQISNVNQTTGVVSFSREYAQIIDSMEIIPHVFSDGTIGLETNAIFGSKSTPEGVKQLPIVTRREINIKENRIRNGESLVIGGIQKTEQRSVVRGIPFFKDLPLIGILFSSKDFEERGKEVLFIITPSISTGGEPNEEILAELRHKHQAMKQEGIFEELSDPFGHKAYTGLVEEEATRAEVDRIKAEMDKAEAERQVKALEDKLTQTSTVNETYRSRAESATTAEKTATTALEAEKQKAAAAIADRDKVVAENQKKMEAAKAAAAEAQKGKKDTETEIAEWMKAHGIKPQEKPPQPSPAPAPAPAPPPK